MLQRLIIHNYAIIENVDIKFSDKLTIITGETGAGKSILIGATSLILGGRADSKVLYNKDKKCIVEGYFDIKNYRLENFFQQNDLDYEDILILRREILSNGKSRAFINDTPVNLSTLKTLGDNLVDIHAQYETLELKDTIFHLTVIDAFTQHDNLINDYRIKFKDYQENVKTLNKLIEANTQADKDLDYYQFQYKELKEADLSNDEQEQLEQELSTLENAEEIKQTLLNTLTTLNENENAVSSQLNSINQAIVAIKKFHPKLEGIYERFESSLIEIKDIADELLLIEQSINYDTNRLEEVNERLNVIYKLEKKHGVSTIAGLLEIENNLCQKIESINNTSNDINKLQEDVNKQKDELIALSDKLSANRKQKIPGFESSVDKLFSEVGMAYAKIKVEHEVMDNSRLNNNGKDKILILFSPNKGKTFLPTNKIASGGELSRLMLCIKSLIAKLVTLPTIIFDEIDAGVSGEIAFKIGNLLQQLSQNHQVICITHSPQIASKGSAHYYVYKEAEAKKIATKLKPLKKEERILEIAKMLSGEKPTNVAVENAKELLGA